MTPLRTTLALAMAAVVLWAAVGSSTRPPSRPRRGHAGDGNPATSIGPAPATRDESRPDGRRTEDAPALASLPALPKPLPEPLADPLPPVEGTTAIPAPPHGVPSTIVSRNEEIAGPSAPESPSMGDVLVGPSSFPGSAPARRPLAGEPVSVPAGPPPAADPGRRALESLGLDLEHPEEALRRLVEEYRASLDASERDAERMALVDQAIAAIVRNYAETTDALFTLFVQERHPGMGRHLAYLLRDVKRVDQESSLLLMAAADPDDGRRANALASIAPARDDAAFEVLLVALGDPSAGVRLASAEALEASLAARPGLRAAERFEERIVEARDAETDEGVMGLLARLASRP